MSSMYSIGVDIGGSHITSCMYEHSNNILDRSTLINLKIKTKGTKEEILEKWACAIAQTISLAHENFHGVGIAMPGPFDYYNGISLIKNVNKLDSLYNVNIRYELASRLKMSSKNIRFINDATAFSIAEAKVGKASTYRRSVAITLGTGFGSSFLINGRPVFNGNEVPAGGFLYNKYYKGDQLADAVFSTRGIINRYVEISGIKIKNVRELCDRIPEDEEVIKVFKWFGAELGKFLKPYLTNFGAEVLVIGGNIAKAYVYFSEDLMRQLPGLDIFVSDFGEEAAIIGSGLLLDDDYYSELKPTLKLM